MGKRERRGKSKWGERKGGWREEERGREAQRWGGRRIEITRKRAEMS